MFPGTDRFKTLRLAFYQVASATLMVVVSRLGGGGGESGETERAGGRLRRHDVTVWTCWASAAGCARHSTDAGARCYDSGRLGMAVFNSRLLGVFPPPGGALVDEQVL